MKLGDVLRSGDWKSEKHVPVIEAPDTVAAGQPVDIKISIGEEIPHPNTAEHHIRWIKLLFQPNEGFTFELADVQFAAHGEGLKGPAEGPCYTEPSAAVTVRLKESGTLLALSYCNIHGLWESSKAITVE
ncbi:MAG: class II SORL domain-containing protein [Limnochordia bacterium]|jgi:superoxide reductase|nr:class II SORL domain-containing protein [Bacillota bacterium]NLL09058.1 Neelaredoxin [Bacillota bacterium]